MMWRLSKHRARKHLRAAYKRNLAQGQEYAWWAELGAEVEARRANAQDEQHAKSRAAQPKFKGYEPRIELIESDPDE